MKIKYFNNLNFLNLILKFNLFKILFNYQKISFNNFNVVQTHFHQIYIVKIALYLDKIIF